MFAANFGWSAAKYVVSVGELGRVSESHDEHFLVISSSRIRKINIFQVWNNTCDAWDAVVYDAADAWLHRRAYWCTS